MTGGKKTFIFVSLVMLISSMYLWAKPEDVIAYPAGFRNWNHVRSALVGPSSPAYQAYGGLHHIYANAKSMEGFRDGKFPDGSVLVFDLLETKEHQGTTIEGGRKFIDMMVKDGKRFADTGGWGYERYAGDSQTERMLTTQAKTACYKCHATQKDNDYVFSKLRE
jgi:Cytochrome P460